MSPSIPGPDAATEQSADTPPAAVDPIGDDDWLRAGSWNLTLDGRPVGNLDDLALALGMDRDQAATWVLSGGASAAAAPPAIRAEAREVAEGSATGGPPYGLADLTPPPPPPASPPDATSEDQA